MKKKSRIDEDITIENIFCIRENGKWVAGVCHARRTQKPVEDKKKDIALAKLANELYKKLKELK